MHHVHRSKTESGVTTCSQIRRASKELGTQCCGNRRLCAASEIGTHESTQNITTAAGRETWIAGDDRKQLLVTRGHHRGNTFQENCRPTFLLCRSSRGPRIELAGGRQRRKEPAEFSGMWRKHQLATHRKRRQLRRGPGECSQ